MGVRVNLLNCARTPIFYTMTEEDIAKNQWMQFLSLWREYESGIIA